MSGLFGFGQRMGLCGRGPPNEPPKYEPVDKESQSKGLMNAGSGLSQGQRVEPKETTSSKQVCCARCCGGCFCSIILVILLIYLGGAGPMDTQGGLELEIPKGTYSGTCPFQQWFPSLPPKFSEWETSIDSSFTSTWQKKGMPTGIREDDHDFGTILGQGNTIGFVAARLTIGGGPDSTKYGLFASPVSLPAVVRFSDFGSGGPWSNSNPQKLARMAVKVPLQEGAWNSEANLLTVEALDAFPLADYRMLDCFVLLKHSDKASFAEKFKCVLTLLKVAPSFLVTWSQNLRRFTEKSKMGILEKTYYSQLPYMLGASQAMKFSFVPRKSTCSGVKDVASHLVACDAIFDVQLQVKTYDSSVDSEGGHSWSELPVVVGNLTIPRQTCVKGTGVSKQLQSVAAALGLRPDAIDKAFQFHPVATHYDNRPVGHVQSFRSAYYSHHAASCCSTMQRNVFTATGNKALVTRMGQFPFGSLTGMGNLSR